MSKKRRLGIAFAAGALVAAMLPGVASAGAPEAETSVLCQVEGGVIIVFDESTDDASTTFGNVVSAYTTLATRCGAGSTGSLTVNGAVVAEFGNR